MLPILHAMVDSDPFMQEIVETPQAKLPTPVLV